MLLHMLRWIIGDVDFFKGMNDYLKDPKLQYGFARSSDFISHMETATGHDLTGFFADWLYGQGYPTYTVNVSQSADHSISVTIYQSQSHSSVSFFELPVPVKFFGGGRDTTLVFNHTSTGQIFNANPGFAIDSVKFDPDLRLVSKNNTVTLGVSDLPAGKELTLMPNPANDFLYVKHNLGQIKSFEILAMDGKSEKFTLKKKEETNFEIDTHTLKAGMYLLRISFKEGIVTRKFVIKR
jgi:hypothetical protein